VGEDDLSADAAHVADDGDQRQRDDDAHHPQHLGEADQLPSVAVVTGLGDRCDRDGEVGAGGQAAKDGADEQQREPACKNVAGHGHRDADHGDAEHRLAPEPVTEPATRGRTDSYAER
jgi:hypothetical protein